VTQKELESLETYYDSISHMGFDINILSQGNILIEGIPDFIRKENIENIFRKILEDISDIGSL
jgi:DNA mismatch repair ATPase MutL